MLELFLNVGATLVFAKILSFYKITDDIKLPCYKGPLFLFLQVELPLYVLAYSPECFKVKILTVSQIIVIFTEDQNWCDVDKL